MKKVIYKFILLFLLLSLIGAGCEKDYGIPYDP